MTARQHLVFSILFFTLAQACVKLIPQVPAHEIVFLRSLISGVLTLVLIRRAGLNPLGHNRPMLALRGLLGSGAMILYFYTLQTIPLASAVTLHYLYPLFTVILAAVLLKERPEPTQWFCLVASFAGVCFLKEFDARLGLAAVAIAILSALMDAATFTTIRALRDQDHTLVIIFYLPLVSVLGLAPYTLTHFTVPSPQSLLVIIAVGVLAQLGQYSVTRAYQIDRAANIANLNYLGPLFALGLGLAIWGERISTLGTFGLLLIVASASFSAFRKHKLAVDPRP